SFSPRGRLANQLLESRNPLGLADRLGEFAHDPTNPLEVELPGVEREELSNVTLISLAGGDRLVHEEIFDVRDGKCRAFDLHSLCVCDRLVLERQKGQRDVDASGYVAIEQHHAPLSEGDGVFDSWLEAAAVEERRDLRGADFRAE